MFERPNSFRRKTTVTAISRTARITSTLAAFILALAIGVGLPLGGSAAEAHDQLIRSTPESGAVLDAAPTEASLVFSGTISELGSEVALLRGGAPVELSDELKVDGAEVKVALPALEDGAYELNWRVVSSDGHPISGTVPFTIGNPAAGGGSDAVGGVNNQPNDPENFDAEGDSNSGGNSLAMIAMGVVGVAVIGAAAVLMVKRFKNGNSPMRPDVFSASGSTAETADAAHADHADTDDTGDAAQKDN